MKVDNCIFDLDGTLIDSFPGIQYAFMEALKISLPGRSIPDLRPHIGAPIRKIFKKLFEDATPDLIDELERQFRIVYDKAGWRKSIAYNGVSETLAKLTKLGVVNFIVTNKPILSTSKIILRLRINKYFQEIISPDIKNPFFNSKQVMTDYLLNKYMLFKKRTIFIGDSEDDYFAAKKCGLRFIIVTYGYGKVLVRKQAGSLCCISNISEILNLIDY